MSRNENILLAAMAVNQRYISGGFEDATWPDRIALDRLKRALTAAPELPEITDVLFRVSKSKAHGLDVYALFPGHVGTNEPHTCSCYQQIGQHCSADLKGCIEASRPATPDEYANLKRELESAPYRYRLRVINRATALHQAAREGQCSY